MMTDLNYNTLTQNFIQWAKTQDDILAIVMVGSRARINHSTDQHSDLDTIMYTSDPDKYSRNYNWLESFGPLIISYLGFTNLLEPEVFGLYEGMLKMDILITKVSENPESNLQDWFNHSPHDVVLQHGYQILLDKTSSQGKILRPDWQFSEEK
jgi:aminoglycoside 6-adenylyltransferase